MSGSRGSLILAFVALAVGAAPTLAQGFGAAVAASPDEVLVGDRGGQTSAGRVFVYRRGPDGWTEAATIRASDAEDGDGFGSALALDGDRLLVGSSSAAYLFERSGSAWRESARIPLEENLRITSALLLEDAAFVGSGTLGGFRGPGEPGRVLSFARAADGTWRPTGELTLERPTAGDGFGVALASVGDRLLVGAPGATVGSTTQAGSVFVYERTGDGGWSLTADPMTAARPSSLSRFGSALLVSSDGERTSIFVGAAGTGGVGAVYAFEGDPDEGLSQTAVFLPPVAEGFRAAFGGAMAEVGDELWVGGVVDRNREGRVFRYRRDGDGWTFAGALAGENLGRGAGFGSRIAASDGVAVVAATGKDYGWGTAYLFEPGADGWAQAGEVWSEVEGYAAITGGEVDCDGGTAAAWECEEVDIRSFLPVSALGAGRGVRTNDVWGWTDPQTGREYALVGLTDQASFVDITDAENPRYVGRLPMTEGANGSTWRDIKVYRDHAFIVSDGAGPHGMQVFDLTRLRDVGSEPVTFEADALYDRIASAHNIVINEETGFAYAVGSSGGGETCGGGLHMIDIRNPTEPAFAGCFADARTGRRETGYSHDAMCIEYHGPDTEHAGREICFGSNETAISIADVSDKEHPVALSFASYPNVGYAHQGWITEDHRYFYLDDELDEIADTRDGEVSMPGTRTMIWDVTDLDDPVLVKEHYGKVFSSDHNLYIRGNLMYQSNYLSGLRILDISDPENPAEIAHFDTVPYADGAGFGGSWSNYPYFQSGTVIVTSGNEGLFMLRHRRPELVP